MVIIGYGKDKSGKDYWLVRNSWVSYANFDIFSLFMIYFFFLCISSKGKSWGEKGYFRMAMNRGNNCNLACYAMGVE